MLRHIASVSLAGIKINLVGSFLIFILLIILLSGFTAFIYRKTNPPVSTGLRRFLMILRMLTVCLVVLLLFEPLASLTWIQRQKPITAVLMDTSASMSLTDSGVSRSEEARRVLHRLISNKQINPQFYQFSDHLKELDPGKIDSLKYLEDGTDITAALRELETKMADSYLSSVILISDGNYNIGENPARYAEKFNVPIHTIAIGNPAAQKDIVISKIMTNQIAYANTRVPVEVTVKATGYANKKVTITLKKDDIILDSKLVELTDYAMESKVRLDYSPTAPGYFKYTVSLPTLEGELTTLNNSKSFYVKVLKSKMQILLIAGAPGFDFSFIKRALNDDPNMETAFWVLKNRSQFYEGNFPNSIDSLKKYDCMVLINFPPFNLSIPVVSALQNVIDGENKPLLFISGSEMNFNALQPLQKFLPVALSLLPVAEQEVFFKLTPSGLNHPIMRLFENDLENQRQWADMPPIYYGIRNVKLTTGSLALLNVDVQRSKLFDINNELPLIVVKTTALQKTIMVLGYGIWRWDFLLKGIGKTEEFFKQFLSNSIRWLVTTEDKKLVRIVSDKEIYRSGETIGFTAETYYEDYRPLDGAQVKLIVTGKSKTQELVLSSIGNGKYEGEFYVLEQGDYSFQGQAFYQNRLVGEDSGRFSVEAFNLEFLDTRMNEILLQQISHHSNGNYFTVQNVDSIHKGLNFPVKKTKVSRDWEIWNHLSLLITVIALLSVEWFIRKKRGML